MIVAAIQLVVVGVGACAIDGYRLVLRLILRGHTAGTRHQVLELQGVPPVERESRVTIFARLAGTGVWTF